MNKSQKALQAVLVEGITPAEAAERYGISTAAISKAKHHTSKKQLHAAEIDALRAQLAEAVRDAERYRELIMAVERKFPNESRHETALRYIKAGERKTKVVDAGMAKVALRQAKGD